MNTENKRVLVIAAHPDDEVLGCGGTVARHGDAGDEVHVLIMAEGATSRTGTGTGDADYTEDLKKKDWATEANVIKALKEIGHTCDLVGVFDRPDIISEKIQQFQPTILFNLVERFNHSTDHDRDVASFFRSATQRLPIL